MLSSLKKILDFDYQLKWLSNEKGPSEFLVHVTQTPFSESSMEKCTYSCTIGFVLNENPNSFSFSIVIILHLKYGAKDFGLILKYLPGDRSKCSNEYLCTYLSVSKIGSALWIPKNQILYISKDVSIFHIISLVVEKWCSTELSCWKGTQLLHDSPLPSLGIEGLLNVASSWDWWVKM